MQIGGVAHRLSSIGPLRCVGCRNHARFFKSAHLQRRISHALFVHQRFRHDEQWVVVMTSKSTSRIASILNVASVFLLILMTFAISTPANAFPEVHTVTFSENASASDSVTAFENGSSLKSLTLIQNLSPGFSNAGYTFQGWNTSADGGGASYADGSTYTFSSDIGLYAQWIAIVTFHTVTFNENDSASDSVSTDLTESAPTQLTSFASLQPAFTYPGYSFSGWNTTATGSGISYGDGSQYSFASDMSLYAQWSLIAVVPTFHTVTFNENDSASDSVSTDLTESAPTQLTSFASLQPAFTYPGYSFSGWNTTATGSGISYGDGSQYSFASDMSLYAQWSLIAVVPTFHTVTFNENDSASDSVSTDLTESAPTPLTPFVNLRPEFVDTTHSFAGWNTSRDGSGTSYIDGSQFSFKLDLVLYAQWTLPVVDTLSFNANGGNGSVASISASPGSTITVPGQAGIIRAGFLLDNWNTSANGTGTKYLVGSHVSVTASILLYAQWSGHKLATLFSAIGVFKSNSSLLSAALKSQINRIAHTIVSRKYHTVTLFGYTAATGLRSLNVALSRSRAANAAIFLRHDLNILKDHGVSISSAGEGAIAGQSSSSYSRVEVFGV